MFVCKGGVGALHWQGRSSLSGEGICAGGPCRRKSHSVGILGIQQKQRRSKEDSSRIESCLEH